MAFEDYVSIEFGIGIESQNQPDILFKINVNEAVQQALYEMKEEFDRQYMNFPDAPTLFELSEKYSSSEHLFYPLVQNDLPDLFHLYTQSAQIPLNDVDLGADLPNISYYFAIFNHGNGSKTIGVKRPNMFKGLLKSRNRIVRLVNDSLMIVPDDLFKLDFDYDFFVNQNTIDILHPSGFLYISKLDEQTLAHAADATNALAARIDFINFAHLAPLVAASKTAARLISSIKSRIDLEQTSQQRLLAKCMVFNIAIQQAAGLIAPQDDNQLVPFLQILDRRLYDYELIDDLVEEYVAGSRAKRI